MEQQAAAAAAAANGNGRGFGATGDGSVMCLITNGLSVGVSQCGRMCGALVVMQVW